MIQTVDTTDKTSTPFVKRTYGQFWSNRWRILYCGIPSPCSVTTQYVFCSYVLVLLFLFPGVAFVPSFLRVALLYLCKYNIIMYYLYRSCIRQSSSFISVLVGFSNDFSFFFLKFGLQGGSVQYCTAIRRPVSCQHHHLFCYMINQYSCASTISSSGRRESF